MTGNIGPIRERLAARADDKHAAFHRAYHKSQRQFYGLRSADLAAVAREQFPIRKKLARDRMLPLIDELTLSPWAEENWLGFMLLARIQPQLSADDVPYLRELTRRCDGWAWLDSLALSVVSPLALRLEGPIFEQVRGWSGDDEMWTRRASILVHILPGRRERLAHGFAWATFEERLHEKEFFIRKAIGWTLRECSKKYPLEVAEFLDRVRDRASGLTFREGSRNLPAELREKVLASGLAQSSEQGARCPFT